MTPTLLTPSSPALSPRYATPRDPERPSRGAVTLAHLARLRRAAPYAWQWQVAETAGELNDAGDGFRYPVVVLSVPRRAGKSTLTLAVNLDHLDVTDDARCWYTAQKRETAAKLFRDEWAPMLEPLGSVYRLRRAQGSEGVLKRRGSSRLQLFAPTLDALHSTNADTATIDEAWSFDIATGDAVEAGVKPAQLTRPWRQLWIVSAGGTLASTWWDRWLQLGESGAPGVALFDWGADPSAPDYDPGNPAIWQRAHPTAGVAFPIDVLAHEWARRHDDADFERSYLNVWPRPSQLAAAGGLDLDGWRSAASPAATVTPVCYALDVAGDRSAASIAAAGLADDGSIVVEIVEHGAGVAWVAGAVRACRGRGLPVVADSLVAASVVSELARARVTVEPVGASDHARACSTLVDLLAGGRFRHRSQAILDAAVLGAARRPLGDAWLWSRNRSSVDISPLVAATLAAWWAHSHPRIGRPAVVVPAGAARQSVPPASRRPPVRR